MPPDKKKPPAGDRRLSENVLAGGFDVQRDNPPNRKTQARPSHRAGFARDMVFAEFGYCAGRALDYDGFVDRKPNPATVWWRS